MLTVADTLQLDELKGAKVVAGNDGLNRQVGWVHVAGVPDAPNWLNGGELVLTTMINLPNDPGEQQQYIQAMADKGVAALALAVGRYIDQAPQVLRETAERNHFPLIEIPYQARFVDIARATNERISQENMALLERALTIHRTLTQIVLDGGDLKQLAVTMADLVGQSISIENERFEALAAHNIAAVDEARRYTLSEGYTDPRLINALEERGILGKIRRTLRPVHIPQMADVGLEMERILAPIVVHGSIYGYVWIIADDRPISDLDELAIESGATIAALMLLHQEALQSAEASLKGGLLAQLIEGEGARNAILTDQALRYGVDLSEPFVLLMIEPPPDRGSQRLMQLYRQINRLSANWRVIVGQFAGEVLVLAQASLDLAGLAANIHALANGARVAISGVQPSGGSVAAAHGQCRDALYISRRLDDPADTVYFDQLGYLHALYRAGTSALHSNPYVPSLRRLDEEQQADLFHTLEVFLDAGGSGVNTAELLSIHRSTLNYRLDRIEEILGVKLKDPLVRTNLQVALKLMRLFETP